MRTPTTNPMHDRRAVRIATDSAVFVLLVAIAVAGRWAQPVWNFTPLAAVALFAGAYFQRRSVAVLVPIAAMAISNFALAGYSNAAVMVSVYVMLAAPALAGRWLRPTGAIAPMARLGRLAVAALAPSTAFFLVTNFAEWAFTGAYAKSLAGLAESYAAAAPFYRQMMAGDLFYVAALFGGAALAGVFATPRTLAEAPVARR